MTIATLSGATTNLGPRLAEKQNGSQVNSFGREVELVYDFDYNTLPTASSDNAAVPVIPAYAAITGCDLQVIATFVGGTSLEVGTLTPAAIAVDVDGLIPAAVGVTANLVLGNYVFGRGVQIVEAPDAAGTAHGDGDGVYVAGANGPVASVASQVSVVAVGTFTAGRARLRVRYLKPE
ncbi:MAG: hypothetical protein M0P95_17770 [Sulfuritalea sp.]|jgi:hypothetical protein|nr:hypothetical protein [Sulfuritalea sp.]